MKTDYYKKTRYPHVSFLLTPPLSLPPGTLSPAILVQLFKRWQFQPYIYTAQHKLPYNCQQASDRLTPRTILSARGEAHNHHRRYTDCKNNQQCRQSASCSLPPPTTTPPSSSSMSSRKKYHRRKEKKKKPTALHCMFFLPQLTSFSPEYPLTEPPSQASQS